MNISIIIYILYTYQYFVAGFARIFQTLGGNIPIDQHVVQFRGLKTPIDQHLGLSENVGIMVVKSHHYPY